MRTAADHLQREVTYPYPPQRIVSLCPSITETLYALGLSAQVVGRTRYCIHPEDQVRQAAVVGGTKQVKDDMIAQLAPDLIIAEKEENPKEMVERLAAQYPVYVVNVEQMKDALQMIGDLGSICGKEDEAREMKDEIERKFRTLKPVGQTIKAAYVIWKNPYMVAGQSTYIHSMLEHCGFINVFKDAEGRYPTVTIEDFRQAAPDVILLSSEPYPFKAKDRDEFLTHVPESVPVLVDGESFSWYGVRMIQAADQISGLLRQLS